MNKYFQSGRKQEESDQPHNQIRKASHDKKDLKTLQYQIQPENKLEKTQQRLLLKSSYSSYCRVTLLFIYCDHLQHCQGKTSATPPCPILAVCRFLSLLQQWHFLCWGMCLWTFSTSWHNTAGSRRTEGTVVAFQMNQLSPVLSRVRFIFYGGRRGRALCNVVGLIGSPMPLMRRTKHAVICRRFCQ